SGLNSGYGGGRDARGPRKALDAVSMKVKEPTKSPQVVFQLHCALSLLIAILHDHRSVKGKSPGPPHFTAHATRTRYDNRARGNLQRRLGCSLVDFFADQIVNRS